MLKLEQEPKYDIIKGKLVNRESGKRIPDDEPVFIFRGQDLNALEGLMAYKKVAKGRHKQAVQARINQIRAWQKANKDRTKSGDSTAAEVAAAKDLI